MSVSLDRFAVVGQARLPLRRLNSGCAGGRARRQQVRPGHWSMDSGPSKRLERDVVAGRPPAPSTRPGGHPVALPQVTRADGLRLDVGQTHRLQTGGPSDDEVSLLRGSKRFLGMNGNTGW